MTDTHDRVQREAAQYNANALQRATYDSVLAHAADGPARHRRDARIAAVMSAAKDLDILEIGSQAWSSCFAKHGIRPSKLTCINISQRELEMTRPEAERLGFDIDFRLMDAHELQFADSSFDLVYGTAILHHLDMARAIPEIARVLKPGGRILFVEPLLSNPVARIVRYLTPNARTIDERPLDRNDLRLIERYFETEHLFTELFAVPAALVSRAFFSSPSNWAMRLADRIDQTLVDRVPAMGAYFRTITICGRRRIAIPTNQQ